MRKKKKQASKIVLAAVTALSAVCTSVFPTSTVFAEEGIVQQADADYVFEGNMLQNPSFDDGLNGWNGEGHEVASNNPCPDGGPTFFYVGGNGWIGQKLQVPYTGYYKASMWCASAGPAPYFGVNNDTTGEENGIDMDGGSVYTKYEQEVWLNKGDTADVFVLGNGSWWVNGDLFSLTYNENRYPNILANPDFEKDSYWEKTGNATIAEGQAVLTDAEDSISQGVYIPQLGPYYAEVELEGAEEAVVSFAGKEQTVSGNQTVKIAFDLAESFEDHTERILSISGKAVVKSAVVKFNLSEIPTQAPVASDVKIEGEGTADLSLTGTYVFTDPDGDTEGTSQYQWMLADSADGEFVPIEGATAERLLVKKEWEDKYLKFQVTPADKYEKVGESVASEAVGPLNVNMVHDPGFENNGENWKGHGLNNQDAYDGLVRGIVGKNTDVTQEITVERDGYYNLSAYVRYAGAAQDGQFTLEDESGNIFAEIVIPATTGWEKIEDSENPGIPLEKGQKVIVRFKGASDESTDIDNVYLMRDREHGTPSFSNVIELTTSPEAFKTVIDRTKKEVWLTYLYGKDISNVEIDGVVVSEGAAASLKEGDIFDLNEPVKFAVTGKEGNQTEWTIKADFTKKKVQMTSSNEYLEDTFNWAAYKMDQFVMTDKHGPVNKDENRPSGTGEADYEPSYWAGYYDRSAYYSRDFVHQATGGQIAGLEEENYNMFKTFAEGSTEARKWYTLWCYNFDGTPHTIDYRDDSWFVREVPAQFELVEKAYKQYLWSGDERYISDEMFEFYTNVMTKFVEAHDTNGNGVAEGTGGGIFEGTASYNERSGEKLLESGDSIGSQYQATLAYAGILKARGDEQGAKEWYQKAADLKKYFNEEWSVVTEDTPVEYRDLDEGREGIDLYARGLKTDNTVKYIGFGGENSWFMPMKLITEPGERNDAYIDFILESIGTGIGYPGAHTNLEAYTYIPDMLFPYNRNEEAWKWMKYITSVKDEPHERPSQGTNGDYPEISFTFVSHVIEGMMGVEPNAVEGTIATSPRLPQEIPDVTADYIDIGDYELNLTHTGNTASDLTNNGEKAITWEARFYGEHDSIMVGDEVFAAQHKDMNGVAVSYVTATVEAGETVHAEVCEEPETPAEVNKSELQKKYDDVKNIVRDDYPNATDDVWNEFAAARDHAADILASDEASQADVDAAVTRLNTAYKALEDSKDDEKDYGKGADNDEGDGKKDAPKTGDDASPGIVMMAAVGALAVIFETFRLRRRK